MCIDLGPLRSGSAGLRQRGVTLIELVMFIVIVGVAVAGILMVMTITTKHSADPMLRKQAIAVAESLLEEIELQPFTYCDVNDSTASTATGPFVGAGGCTATVQGLGASGGKTRYVDPRFDNVGDYNGFAMNGILDMNNTPVGGLQNYSATVAITSVATGGIQAADSLRINVTVTAPGGEAVTLTGYRFRYAPRAIP